MADVTLQQMVALLDERGKVLVKPGQKKKATARKAANGVVPDTAAKPPTVRKPAKKAAPRKTGAKKAVPGKAVAKAAPKRAAAKPAKAPVG